MRAYGIQELQDLLKQLVAEVSRMEDRLEPGGKAPSETATSSGFGPRPPLNVGVLSFLLDRVDPTVWGWCHNLADEIGEPCPRRADSTSGARWLYRHANQLFEMEWCGECVAELHAVIDGIQEYLARWDQDQVQFVSLADLARVCGCSYEAMRKRIARGKVEVEVFTVGGRTYYRLPAGL